MRRITMMLLAIALMPLAALAAGNLYMIVDLSGGPTAASYPVSYLSDVPSGGWTDEYKTDKLVLRRIEPGTFLMGYKEEDYYYKPEEETLSHPVTLTKPFYVGVFETTQRQWELVMGDRPSNFATDYEMRPVECVGNDRIRGTYAMADWPISSTVDAQSFVGRIRAKTGKASFDLPTAAQWEYACRAGTETLLYDGSKITGENVEAMLDALARNRHNQSGDGKYAGYGTARVGSYAPNNWGLYDMLGNVWEKCLDWYERPKVISSAVDPVGPETGEYKVIRGGSWDSASTGIEWCRCAANAGGTLPDSYGAYFDGGFRLAMTVENSFGDGLVAWYKFDGDTRDSSGHGNDLTLVSGSFSGVAGVHGTAVQLNASTTLGMSGVLAVSNSFSYSCWCRTSKQVSLCNPSSKGTDYDCDNFVLLPSQPGAVLPGHVGIGIKIGSNGINVYEHAGCYRVPVLRYDGAIDGGWHNVTLTVEDDGVPVVYLDGARVESQSINNGTRKGISLGLDDNNLYAIGACHNGINLDGYFDGAIDDMRLYDRSLSASEVRKLFERRGLVAWYKFDGDAKDSSDNENDGVVCGATLTADRFGNANSAYLFDGDDDYILVPFSEALGEIRTNVTMLGWVRIDAWADDTGYETAPVFCKGNDGHRQWGLQLVNNSEFAFNDHVNVKCDCVVETGLWQHVAISYDGNWIRAYLNGAEVGILPETVDFNDAMGSALLIGVDPPSYCKEYLKGALDDLRIYNRALSAAEVVNIYNEGGDPIVYRTVTFDGNGGVASAASRSVENGAAVGELPTATREGYDFVGWFTAAVGGTEVTATTIVDSDVTYFAQWKAQETDLPTYGPFGEGEDVANPDKLGPTMFTAVALTIDGEEAAVGDCVAVYRGDTGALCGLGKVLETPGALTVVCYAPQGVELSFKAWVAASGVAEPTIVACGKTTAPSAGEIVTDTLALSASTVTPSYAVGLKCSIDTGWIGYTVKDLPKGLKYDKKTGVVSGVPTVATSGKVVATFTKKGSATETLEFEIAALPAGATGTFNGFVLSGAAEVRALPDGETVNCGTLQVTVSDVGKIAAKVINAAGTCSFTAAGWDSAADGVYSVMMTTKKGEVLTLACDSAAAWNAKQMTGTLTGGALGDRALPVEAQRNAFGKQWFFNAAPAGGEDAAPTCWVLSFAENAKSAALAVTLNADGKTSISGKLGSCKITASGYVDVCGIGQGALFADFAPVVTVGKAKKVLSIRTNLWFDKKNDHVEGAGSAVFVE